MPAYLVRIEETNEFFGLVWGDSDMQVADVIDEVMDATECEVKKLKMSGIMCYYPTKATLPIKKAHVCGEGDDYDTTAFMETLKNDYGAFCKTVCTRDGVFMFGENFGDDLRSTSGWRKLNI